MATKHRKNTYHEGTKKAEASKRSCLNCLFCQGDGVCTNFSCELKQPEFDTYGGYCGYHQKGE